MSTDFDQLIASIDLEARQEGPDAVRELTQFREEFGSASRTTLCQREETALSSAADHSQPTGNNSGNKLRKT
jgi:hypothetical protein